MRLPSWMATPRQRLLMLLALFAGSAGIAGEVGRHAPVQIVVYTQGDGRWHWRYDAGPDCVSAALKSCPGEAWAVDFGVTATGHLWARNSFVDPDEDGL